MSSAAKSEVKLPKEAHFYTDALSQAANRDSHSAYRVISLVTDLSYNPDIRRWESASPIDCDITIEDLLTEAAEHDHAPSQYKLGCMLASKCEGDYKESIALWEKAAKQYYLPAQKMLGYIYQHGIGVEQDYQKAHDWYYSAYTHNDIDAQIGIAEIYEAQGEIDCATIVYKRVAEQGDARSQFWVAIKLTEDGRAEDASHYLYMAARQCLTEAQYQLGVSYAGGNGVEKDPEQAFRYLRLAMRGELDSELRSAAKNCIELMIDEGDLTRERIAELEAGIKQDVLAASASNTVDKYRTKDYLIFRTC